MPEVKWPETEISKLSDERFEKIAEARILMSCRDFINFTVQLKLHVRALFLENKKAVLDPEIDYFMQTETLIDKFAKGLMEDADTKPLDTCELGDVMARFALFLVYHYNEAIKDMGETKPPQYH